MTNSGRIELMAPAGDFTSMQAALDNGADSIYFGDIIYSLSSSISKPVS